MPRRAALLSLLVWSCAESAPPASPPAAAPPPPPPAAVGAPAAPCTPQPPACHADRRAVVSRCGSRDDLVRRCLGPRGCVQGPGGPECDESVAGVGEPCAAEGGFACSADGGSMLVCARGRQAVASTCKGPRRCSVQAGVACDTATADAGDPCADEGRLACSRDTKTLLKCRRGAFGPDQACARMACMISGSSVLCQ